MARRIDAVILLGRPGCGKDTQAKLLARRMRARIINTGDLMRRMASKKGPFALYLRRKILQKGKLAPPWLAAAAWFGALARISARRPVIFNGSPRTRDEAEWLSEALVWYGRKTLAAHVTITSKESLRRLSQRKRKDDHPVIVRTRLRYFAKNTMPAIRFFSRKGMLTSINGQQPPKNVFEDLLTTVRT